MTFSATHPLTGKPLNSEQEAIASAREADAYVSAEIGKAYAALRETRERLLKLRGELPPAAMPARRYRTDTQNKVALCKRCGSQIEETP